MSNYFGNLPQQFNNKHINNNLVNGYNQFANTNNIPFANNPMLGNNPVFAGAINDPHFHNRINIAKMEQLKKINSVKDLGIDNNKLIEYIICPLKNAKINTKAFNAEYDNKLSTYVAHNGKQHDDKYAKSTNESCTTLSTEIVPQLLVEWYSGRKNVPYKNILKDENYKKEFKNKDDLIVHKVTQLDKDRDKLKKEFKLLTKLLEVHDGEIKVIYSLSEESKHKEQFNYTNYYKNTIKYDPKNYGDLKKFYNKEQKKINKNNKRMDEMLEMMLASNQFTKDEIEELKKSGDIIGIDVSNDVENTSVTFDNDVQKHHDAIELEKQLEKQLRKELGKEKYNELMSQINDKNNSIDKDNSISNDNNVGNNTEESKPIRKLKIKKTKIEQQNQEIGFVDDDEFEKYRSIKKK